MLAVYEKYERDGGNTKHHLPMSNIVARWSDRDYLLVSDRDFHRIPHDEVFDSRWCTALTIQMFLCVGRVGQTVFDGNLQVEALDGQTRPLRSSCVKEPSCCVRGISKNSTIQLSPEITEPLCLVYHC